MKTEAERTASASIMFEKRSVFNVVQIDFVKFFESGTGVTVNCRSHRKDLLIYFKTYLFLDQ